MTMTDSLRRIAQVLVAISVICAVTLLGCGMLSASDNLFEKLFIGLMLLMLGSMVAAIVLVIVTYISLRIRVGDHVRRRSLCDEEFLARMADSKGVDLQLVALVRSHCDGYLRSLGSDRFYPEDRLKDDLHLRDLAPFACEAFCGELEEALGLAEDELLARVATGEVGTFGDLVLAAAALAARVTLELPAVDLAGGQPDANPVWDRTLDG
jgi:hypothetical protein